MQIQRPRSKSRPLQKNSELFSVKQRSNIEINAILNSSSYNVTVIHLYIQYIQFSNKLKPQADPIWVNFIKSSCDSVGVASSCLHVLLTASGHDAPEEQQDGVLGVLLPDLDHQPNPTLDIKQNDSTSVQSSHNQLFSSL